MAILVTGGAGFIGGNFVMEWLKRQDEVVVNLDRLTYAGHRQTLSSVANDPLYVFIHGDMGDSALVDSLLSRYKPRAVINFAAESHVDRAIYAPATFIKTNIVATFHLLESVRLYWERLSVAAQRQFRFLHISTDEVYGMLKADALPFTEQHTYAPNNPYAASKASSDHLVRAWHHTYGLPVLTMHCTNNYGPYHFPEKLIPLMILKALAGQNLPLYGDGQQRRDWLYVKDHCAAVSRVLEKGRVGETYNVGSWNEKSNLEVVQTICQILDDLQPRSDNKSYSAQITFVADRPGHDRRYAIDAGKIEQELGWKPAETFATGMYKTIQWYIDNQDWVEQVTQGSYQQWVAQHYAAS